MSQAASGYDRIPGDRYYTPLWVVEALQSVEQFDGVVWDPAAGAGHIVDCFPESFGTDIAPDRDDIKDRDFLTIHPEWNHGARHIVTNPPYGKGGRLAVEFISYALLLTKPRLQRAGGKVAMLLRVDFDSANTRRAIFKDHPAFSAKYTLTRRIRWANLEQTASGPTDNHAWFVWDWGKQRARHRIYDYLP